MIDSENRFVLSDTRSIVILDDADDVDNIVQNARGRCPKNSYEVGTFKCDPALSDAKETSISKKEITIKNDLKIKGVKNPTVQSMIAYKNEKLDRTGGVFSIESGKFKIKINEDLYDKTYFNNELQNLLDEYDNAELTIANKHFRNDQDKFIKCSVDHEEGHVAITLFSMIEASKTDGFGEPLLKNKSEIVSSVKRFIKDAEQSGGELEYWASGDGDPNWREICRTNAKNGISISKYSLESYHECFAESYCAHKNGIDIPENVRKFIENVDKTLEDF